MKRWMVLLIALVLLVAACSKSDETTEPSAEPSTEAPATSTGSPVGMGQTFSAPPVGKLITYTADADGYSIDYPKNWAGEMGTVNCPTTYCFTAPPQEGQVPAAIMITVGQTQAENLQTGWNTARQLFIGSAGVKPKTVPGTQGDTTMAGQPAKTAQYTLDWGLIPAQMQQTMTLNADNTPYMVTVISAADIWKDLEPTFTDVTASFALS